MSREFWIDTRHRLSLSHRRLSGCRTTSYLGNTGGRSRLSTVTGIVYRGPFCSMFRTIPPSLFPRHQYPSPRPLERGGRFTRRDVTERDIHRDNRVAKAKGNGTARFRIKLFSLSYPQRQPFCPGKRYSSGCSCHGEGWFPATVGCRPCLSLSLFPWEKRRVQETRKIEVAWIGGGLSGVAALYRFVPRFLLPLIFIFWDYRACFL